MTMTPETPDGHNGWYTTSPVLTLSASDNETFVANTFFRFAGENYQPYTAPVVLPDGSYSIIWYSTDSNGAREQEQSVLVKIDATAPTISVTTAGQQGNNGCFIGNVTITASVQDAGSGAVPIEYNVNDTGWRPYTQPISIAADDNNTIRARCFDAAGNKGEQTITVTIDTTAPTLDLPVSGQQGNAGYYISSITVTAVSQDSVSGID